MNISEVGKQTGLPAKTIRYYEDIGLTQPARDANGYRVFYDTDVHQLSFLARARGLGFTIEDCRTLLALWADKSRASGDVKAIAREHLSKIEEKIADLAAMRDTLADLMESCAGDARPDCPILNNLSVPDKAKAP